MVIASQKLVGWFVWDARRNKLRSIGFPVPLDLQENPLARWALPRRAHSDTVDGFGTLRASGARMQPTLGLSQRSLSCDVRLDAALAHHFLQRASLRPLRADSGTHCPPNGEAYVLTETHREKSTFRVPVGLSENPHTVCWIIGNGLWMFFTVSAAIAITIAVVVAVAVGVGVGVAVAATMAMLALAETRCCEAMSLARVRCAYLLKDSPLYAR